MTPLRRCVFSFCPHGMSEMPADFYYLDMGRKRLSEDGHKMNNVELTRRFHDKAASIDQQLDQAFSQIDWKRRKAAEKSLVAWVKTYCIGLLLDDPPP